MPVLRNNDSLKFGSSDVELRTLLPSFAAHGRKDDASLVLESEVAREGTLRHHWTHNRWLCVLEGDALDCTQRLITVSGYGEDGEHRLGLFLLYRHRLLPDLLTHLHIERRLIDDGSLGMEA